MRLYTTRRAAEKYGLDVRILRELSQDPVISKEACIRKKGKLFWREEFFDNSEMPPLSFQIQQELRKRATSPSVVVEGEVVRKATIGNHEGPGVGAYDWKRLAIETVVKK